MGPAGPRGKPGNDGGDGPNGPNNPNQGPSGPPGVPGVPRLWRVLPPLTSDYFRSGGGPDDTYDTTQTITLPVASTGSGPSRTLKLARVAYSTTDFGEAAGIVVPINVPGTNSNTGGVAVDLSSLVVDPTVGAAATRGIYTVRFINVAPPEAYPSPSASTAADGWVGSASSVAILLAALAPGASNTDGQRVGTRPLPYAIPGSLAVLPPGHAFNCTALPNPGGGGGVAWSCQSAGAAWGMPLPFFGTHASLAVVACADSQVDSPPPDAQARCSASENPLPLPSAI